MQQPCRIAQKSCTAARHATLKRAAAPCQVARREIRPQYQGVAANPRTDAIFSLPPSVIHPDKLGLVAAQTRGDYFCGAAWTE
jgi:hypothetical protein